MSKHTTDDQTNSRAEQTSNVEVHVESHSEQTVSGGVIDDAAVAELTADLQRLQAEFMNYKRRTEAERTDVINFAKTGVVRQFLAVRDTFDAELAHRPAEIDAKWAASIDAIRAQFDGVLKNLGVERFVSVGQPFDPRRHEAVASDGDGETVVAELAPGYQLGELVLRPAMVRVGSAPAETAPVTDASPADAA